MGVPGLSVHQIPSVVPPTGPSPTGAPQGGAGAPGGYRPPQPQPSPAPGNPAAQKFHQAHPGAAGAGESGMGRTTLGSTGMQPYGAPGVVHKAQYGQGQYGGQQQQPAVQAAPAPVPAGMAGSGVHVSETSSSQQTVQNDNHSASVLPISPENLNGMGAGGAQGIPLQQAGGQYVQAGARPYDQSQGRTYEQGGASGYSRFTQGRHVGSVGQVAQVFQVPHLGGSTNTPMSQATSGYGQAQQQQQSAAVQQTQQVQLSQTQTSQSAQSQSAQGQQTGGSGGSQGGSTAPQRSPMHTTNVQNGVDVGQCFVADVSCLGEGGFCETDVPGLYGKVSRLNQGLIVIHSVWMSNV